MAIDLICGMDINEKSARFRENYKGKTYYFCSENCRQAFLGAPQKYAK